MAYHFTASASDGYGKRTACGRDYRDLRGGVGAITEDRAKVSCATCKRSAAFRGLVMCGNEDHSPPRAAIAAMSWPDGRFKPTTACAPCLRLHVLMSVDGTHGEKHPVLVSPLPEPVTTDPDTEG